MCAPSRHMIMTGRSVWHVRGRVGNRKNRQQPAQQVGRRVDLDELAENWNISAFKTYTDTPSADIQLDGSGFRQDGRPMVSEVAESNLLRTRCGKSQR